MARNLTVAIAPDDFKPANELEPAVSPFSLLVHCCASLPGICNIPLAAEEGRGAGHGIKAVDVLGLVQALALALEDHTAP